MAFLCADCIEKSMGFYANLMDFVVEVTGFEPATFWSRNQNRCFPMSYHARCCYKKESLSFDIIGHGRKHSVAIQLQPLPNSVFSICKSHISFCKTIIPTERQNHHTTHAVVFQYMNR